MTNLFKPLLLNLQLFAEGGDGGTGAEGTAESGVATANGSNVQVANAQGTEGTPVDLDAEYKDLIKGKYKAQHDKYMQDTMNKRLKGTNEKLAKYESLAPTLELLGSKYGVDATDFEALSKAIDDDNTLWEEEALERGMSVEDLKYIKKIERENAVARQKEKEARDQEVIDRWLSQAEDTKQYFPNFDFDTEIENPEFRALLNAGVNVKTAYQVIHQNEIIPQLMSYTSMQAEKRAADSIASNGARPTENGVSSQSAALTKSDVSKLTKEQREALIKRAARGEKISFR